MSVVGSPRDARPSVAVCSPRRCTMVQRRVDSRLVLSVANALWLFAGCAGEGDPAGVTGVASSALNQPCAGAVGLALEVDSGEGIPLQVRAGQRFYISQIDIRDAVTPLVDDGLQTLRAQGDLAALAWKGVALA